MKIKIRSRLFMMLSLSPLVCQPQTIIPNQIKQLANTHNPESSLLKEHRKLPPHHQL